MTVANIGNTNTKSKTNLNIAHGHEKNFKSNEHIEYLITDLHNLQQTKHSLLNKEISTVRNEVTNLHSSTHDLKQLLNDCQAIQQGLISNYDSAKLHNQIETLIFNLALESAQAIEAKMRQQTSTTPANSIMDTQGFALFKAKVEAIGEILRNNFLGENAQYIPVLAEVDPSAFRIAFRSVDEDSFEIGFCDGQGNSHFLDDKLTMQSTSKVLLYGLACDDPRLQKIADNKIALEASDQPFNAKQLASATSNTPSPQAKNPYMNIGALTATSILVEEAKAELSSINISNTTKPTETFLTLLKQYQKKLQQLFPHLDVDTVTLKSELDTAAGNRGILNYMKEVGLIAKEEDAETILWLYTAFCALHISTRDLAYFGAMLANGGVLPGEDKQSGRIFSKETVSKLLMAMKDCGMYEASADFSRAVGLPAKSGVSGAIVMPIEGIGAISIYSSPLDKAGNSERGVMFAKLLKETGALDDLKQGAAELYSTHKIAA